MMLIGQDVSTLVILRLDGVYILVRPGFHINIRSKTEFPNPLRKMNNSMASACLRLFGSRDYFMSLFFHSIVALLSMLTKSMPLKLQSNRVSLRTEHIELNCHYNGKAFDDNAITIHHVTADPQVADIFTIALPWAKHQFFIDRMLSEDFLASI